MNQSLLCKLYVSSGLEIINRAPTCERVREIDLKAKGLSEHDMKRKN